MRTGPDGFVRLTVPVREVVPALVAGTGPVRDLVAAEARRAETIGGEAVLLRRPILVLTRRCLASPVTRPRAQRQVVAGRAGQALDVGIVERQRVCRDMVRPQLDRPVERGGPVLDGLVGQVVEQVVLVGQRHPDPLDLGASLEHGLAHAVERELDRRAVVVAERREDALAHRVPRGVVVDVAGAIGPARLHDRREDAVRGLGQRRVLLLQVTLPA